MRDWLKIAGHPSVCRRALRVAVIVGTILALINHGDTLLSGAMRPVHWAKVLLTYLVPYCVSTFASVQAIRHIATADD